MPKKFDPYHKWLGISPKDQPPNHYRLLGLELFESDPDVIDTAASRVMEYLQGVATGPQMADAQALLNEVSAARLCLLNAKKKAAYDRKLRAEQPGPPPPPQPPRRVRGKRWAEEMPLAQAEDDALAIPSFESAESLGQSGSHIHGPRRRSSPVTPFLMLCGILVVVSAVAAIVMLLLNDDNADTAGGKMAQATKPDSKLPYDWPDIGKNGEDPKKNDGGDSGSDPKKTPPDPKLPPKKVDPPPPPDADELFKAVDEAVAKKDAKTAIALLQKYLGNSQATERQKAGMLLGILTNVTSDQVALDHLVKMNAQQIAALEANTLNIQGLPRGMDQIYLDTLKKNLPEGKRRRAKTKDKSPPKQPKTTTPTDPKPKSMPDPKPLPDPAAKPEEFLIAKGLKKRGAYWLLDEDAVTRQMTPLAEADKKLRGVAAKFAKGLNNLQQLKKQLAAYERQREKLENAGMKIPAEIAKFINQWRPKIGNDQAVGNNAELRTAIQEVIKVRNDLALPVIKLQGELAALDARYAELADDPQVATALSKLSGGVRHRLGPSTKLKPSRLKFRKYESLVMTDDVPLYLKTALAVNTHFSGILNEKVPHDFIYRPEMNANIIPEPLLAKAGIAIAPNALTGTFTYGDKAGKQKTVKTRQVRVPLIRVGKHLLKDLEFHATPATATDLEATLGMKAFAGYRVEADLDNFVFKITPEGGGAKME